MSHLASRTATEIATQPVAWRQAQRSVPRFAPGLPRRGERVAVVGCGTSWFMPGRVAYLSLSVVLAHADV
jgi:hypothetical protein